MKKTAVVVGATGNLGKPLCKELRRLHYELDPQWTKKPHPDARNPESFRNFPEKVDLAVYLAGVNSTTPTHKLPVEEWDYILDVNLKGAFLFAKAAFPSLRRAKHSTLVFISSINALHPYPNRVAYAASKAGLEGLTRTLAVEWGRYGISSVCVRLGHLSKLMGTTKTNPKLLNAVKKKTPSGKLVEPEEVAKFIAWLSEEGSQSFLGSVVDFDHAYPMNRWPLD